ncbi:MAG TPA: 50S ribosomal protein L18 [Ignavibacteriales bacterium]|nr:50S ribosomal protein L18 [Ignavibacteriales bacterium]HOL80164.1 50S ribosomal protein L18 [Ignavibacteriales bacterium]HOM64446.1 50S ribosomal protein L18 [Ignavibacteriales bacterium]HPD67933.1 50S ribosomal protein L18 [Ignavibacteriales bacterium]HPP32353.1 50S ribosomal protein L18 [Ignavibacteriales bacterium]
MIKTRKSSRESIKFRIRKKIQGTPERPRMVVYKSLKYIYVQFVDDVNNKTITGVSSLTKEVKEQLKDAKTKIDQSKIVGKYASELAQKNNITKVVFDRNGFRYHGRIKALADAAREAGLQF